MDQVLVYWSMQPILVEEFYDRDQSYDNLFHLGIRNYVFHFKKEKKSKIPLISFAVISNFPWKLRNPFYYKAQTRQIPSLIKPSMSVCGRAAKYVPNHLRLKTLSLKKKQGREVAKLCQDFLQSFHYIQRASSFINLGRQQHNLPCRNILIPLASFCKLGSLKTVF